MYIINKSNTFNYFIIISYQYLQILIGLSQQKHMSINNFVLELDENSDKERQRRLYGHNLQFDPNRPIYQHPINLNNFLQSGEEGIFIQLVKNIRELYPNYQINQDIRLYEQAQQKINNLGEFGFNEQEAILRENQKIKQRIKKKNITIPILGEEIKQLQRENNLLENQTQLLQSFLNINMRKKILEKNRPYKKSQNGIQQTKLNDQLKDAEKQFKQKLSELNEKMKGQVSQFQTQYKAIVYQQSRLEEQKAKLRQIQIQYYEIQTDKSIISKNVMQLQDQIDNINEKIKEEKFKQKSRSILNIKERGSDDFEALLQSDTSSERTDMVKSSSLKSVVQINNKCYTHYQKIDNTKCFLYFLIALTIFLLICTAKKLICD